jgi:hypothetical protein
MRTGDPPCGQPSRENACVQGWQVKRVVNFVNLSTLLGLGVARLGKTARTPGPKGLHLATGYRIGFPLASAFTIGNVVITKHESGWFDERTRLVVHEERHSWQYVACLGLPMIPLYLLAAGYSYLRGGDPATHNIFETRAGLADGGYPLISKRERERLERDAPAA